MYESGVEDNVVIASNYSVNWDEVLNKIKPNLNYFYYEESLNNCVNFLIRSFQLL